MTPQNPLDIFGDGFQRDFYTEVQKMSFHLRTDYTARRLAIYELYKMSMHIPGSVVELGIRHGATFYYFAQLIEIFNFGMRPPSICNRHLFGFDTLEGFPSISDEDHSKHEWDDMCVGGVSTNKDLVLAEFDEYKNRSLIPERLHLVVGDATVTIPKFMDEYKGLKISLLYLDFDLYEPTRVALECMYDAIPPGGIIVLDEYGLTDFPGETQAVDEFFADKKYNIHTFPWAYCPSAYIVKGE